MGYTDELGFYTEEIYTDGSCRRNCRHDASAGVGVFYGDGDERNSVPLDDKQTSQRAELIAIIYALSQAIYDDLDVLIVYTDSQYPINCLGKWGEKWLRNGCRTAARKPVKKLRAS